MNGESVVSDGLPLTLTARDGRALAATLYKSDGAAKASVVMLGAYAVRQRYYRRFAQWLAAHQYSVLTFDCRGIGDSRAGHVKHESIDATGWADLDYGAALSWLAQQPNPRLAVGHSFGGQILGINDSAQCIQGMYAVAAQLAHWTLYEGFARYQMRLLFSTVMPGLTRALGYLPSWTGIGEDVPPNAMLEWTRWLNSPRYLLDHVPQAAERFRAWPGQFVSVGFTDDTYAPPRGVEALAQCFEPSRTQLRILKPSDVGLTRVGHFGFFREHQHEVLWNDCLKHLGQMI